MPQFKQPVNLSDNQTQMLYVIALDPGVRTFMTGYDQSGKTFRWGYHDMSRICRLAIHYDKLQSKLTKVKHHQRYKMRKAARRIQERIRDLITEVHRKLARFLCSNYQVILLPEFNTKDMVKRFSRRISRKTVRQMVTWAHYRFRQFLLHKQHEFGCKVFICDEAYTSKTCGNCGHIHQRLGGAEIFKCPECGRIADRDTHAARNILLRFLTLHAPQTEDLISMPLKQETANSAETLVSALGLAPGHSISSVGLIATPSRNTEG
jgi:putative transposase